VRLEGQRVAVFVEDGFEDLEFWVTVMRLNEEGARVTIVGTEARKEYRGKYALSASSDVSADEVTVDDFDAVVVPGGWAPDKLRRYESVTGLVRKAHDQKKIVGLICHAGLVGISAGIVHGMRATGSKGIKDDLINAGATWVDEPAFIEGNVVWGRVVDDIPDFCRELVAAMKQTRP
jgi:protease I